MTNLDPVSMPAAASVSVVPAQQAEAIKPPSAAEAPPNVAEGRHAENSKSDNFTLLAEDDEELFSLEAAVAEAHGLNDADIASVIEANTQAEPQLDQQALAEARRIKEAFQAGVSVTSLLKIIQGADLSTISLLLGGSSQGATTPEDGKLPV